MSQAFAPAQPQAPNDVALAAHNQRLGALTGICEKSKMLRIVLSSALLAVIMVSVGVAAVPDMDSTGGKIGMLAFFVGLPVGGLVWACSVSPIFSPKARSYRIYLHEEGFVQVSRKGIAAHRWDSIMTVRQAITRTRTNGISTGTNYHYTFTYADGSESTMSSMTADMSELGGKIMDAITAVQIPHAVAAIRAGHTLPFGPFTVNAQGIGVGDKEMIPWAQVAEVDLSGGYFRIKRAGKRMMTTRECAKVPNLYTLLFVASRMTGGRQL
jgi:hypothetical protein